MPCVSPDGKPTESGIQMLAAVKAGNATPEDIAAATGMALFRVRSGIRDMVTAGYVVENNGLYRLTDLGVAEL